ncbi:MAG TPA: PEP-CTERM sorting domain-containing protein [Dongiaceae bacterium]|nr:PEP-CTERM sorting domain-containing protein [Dongiaceae bacterium]
MKKWTVLVLAALICTFCATQAKADTVVLTFEGLGDQAAIGDYYNGGAGGNLGISFGADSLSIISRDAGGSGNFSNAPSGNTIAFFLSGAGDVMNVAAGFTTGFSFFYSAAFPGSVNVYSGLNGTGTLLASLNLDANLGATCTGAGPYCVWTPVGVSFGGTAESVVFSGSANYIGFDNITLGSSTPGTGNGGGNTGVPEPATLALLGFGSLSVLGLRRKKATA